jgi:hypothetical protein
MFFMYVGLLILVSAYLHTVHTFNDTIVWSVPIQHICSSCGLIYHKTLCKNIVAECNTTT